MCSHCFLHGRENSEVYFFIYVYKTVSYVLWIRNRISTVELWVQDQNEREQDALLEAFYNELDKGEMDDDYELESGSDNIEAENEAMWPR